MSVNACIHTHTHAQYVANVLRAQTAAEAVPAGAAPLSECVEEEFSYTKAKSNNNK